jgi:hypothetical protein
MAMDPILTIAASITAIGVIIGGIVATYRLARKINDSIGLDAQGRTLSERLGRVEHQLWPNGGSSLADQVHASSDMAKETAVEVRFIKQMLLASNPSYTPAEEVTPLKPKRTRRKAS